MKSRIIFTLVCFIGFLACTNNDENLLENETLNFQFDKTMYEQYGSQITKLLRNGTFDVDTKMSTAVSLETQARGILDNINNEFRTDVPFTRADADLVNTSDIEQLKRDYIKNGYVTPKQMEIIETFANEDETIGFEKAITNLQNNVLAIEGLTEEEFDQYNYLVNTLYIANDYFTSSDIEGFVKKPSWWKGVGCGIAIASNAVATYGLVACAVPNPTSPAACGVAIAGKALAYAGIVFGCF